MKWLLWVALGLVGLTCLTALWLVIVESDRVYEWRQRRQLTRQNKVEMLAEANRHLRVKGR